MTASPSHRRRRLLACAVIGVVVAGAVAVAAAAVVAAEDRPPQAAGSAGSGGATVPLSLGHGARAPAFSLPRLGGGSEVSLASLEGRPVVLNFFASWCPDCASELHAFAVAWRDLHGRVAFVAVDSNDSDPGKARRLLLAAGDSYPVGIDAYGLTAEDYLVEGLPTTVFISASGRVVDVALGAQSSAQLEHWAAVAEAQPSTPR